jgi:TolB-like protein
MAENITSILILPFDIHAEKDQSFLTPAIMDMLFTRLTAEGRPVIMGDQDISPEITSTVSISIGDAIFQAQQRGADYVVLGSVTLLRNVIRTKAQFIGVAEQKPLVTFNQAGQNQGDIIAHIDSFSSQVNVNVFGLGKTIDTLPSPPKTGDNIYIHPEKLIIPSPEHNTKTLPKIEDKE